MPKGRKSMQIQVPKDRISILGERRNGGIVSRRGALLGLGLAATAGFSARASDLISFRDIWLDGDAISDKARSNLGAEVEMKGYMAPPLKPEVQFFVLTKLPTAICPFCDSTAAWPEDIVLVLMSRPIHAIDYDRLISVKGTLEFGDATDAATGFVSRVRLRNSTYRKA